MPGPMLAGAASPVAAARTAAGRPGGAVAPPRLLLLRHLRACPPARPQPCIRSGSSCYPRKASQSKCTAYPALRGANFDARALASSPPLTTSHPPGPFLELIRRRWTRVSAAADGVQLAGLVGTRGKVWPAHLIKEVTCGVPTLTRLLQLLLLDLCPTWTATTSNMIVSLPNCQVTRSAVAKLRVKELRELCAQAGLDEQVRLPVCSCDASHLTSDAVPTARVNALAWSRHKRSSRACRYGSTQPRSRVSSGL